MNNHLLVAVFIIILAAVEVSGTIELDAKRLEDLLASGRNGMVKFYQPWCGHCTRMKPDWDLLAEHAHESVFIADVNCQIEESLCSDYHTGGTYPTVLTFRYGQPAELYQGGRGFEDLMKYVDKELVKPCSVDSPEATCNEKEVKYVAKWKKKGAPEQASEVSRLQAMETESMTYELSKWRNDRVRILQQLISKGKITEGEL